MHLFFFRTCFYVLGLISKTKRGAEILSSLGWECVRHTHKEYFTVLEERYQIFDKSGMFRD
jgi:rapamycin-insensitive companion of mTOR